LFFFSSRRRHTRFSRDWSSDVCSSDLTALRDLLALLGPDAAATWSASGHGHVGLPAGSSPDEVRDLLARLRDLLGGYRGHAVVRYAPEEVREGVDVWGPVPGLALMRRVKDQFDPEHRLSPGRFVGGI